MEKIEHIIWDWNGTILDDAELCVEITNNMLAERNKPLMTKKSYSENFDFPIEHYYAKIGFDFSEEPYSQVTGEFMDVYEKRKYDCLLNPHFYELQPYIKEKDIKQSILSAYADDYLRDILKYHNILDNFVNVSGLNHILADSKIENGKKLITKINIPKNRCLFIGDTLHDIDAAEAMGIDYCIFPYGHNSLERIKKRTDKIIKSTEELLLRLRYE